MFILTYNTKDKRMLMHFPNPNCLVASPNRSYSVSTARSRFRSRDLSVPPSGLATTAGFFLISRRRQSSARFSTASIVHCTHFSKHTKVMLSFSCYSSLAQCVFCMSLIGQVELRPRKASGWSTSRRSIPMCHPMRALLHFFL